MSKKWRVGIIGIGGICKGSHLPEYLSDERLEVAALCDIIIERAEEIRDKYFPDAAVYSDYKELLKDESIDSIDICTPNYLHSIIAVAAFEAGKHVCGNVSQCERAGRKGSIETEGLRTEALGIGSRPHALALGGLRVCIRVAMGAREERDGRTRVIHGKHGARGVAPPGTVELHEAVLHAFTCEAALKLGIQPCQAIAGACGRVQVVAHRAAEERTDFLDGRQGLLAGVARARDGLSKLGHGLLKDAVVTTPRRIKLLGIPAWRGCLRPRRCARWFLCHVYPCLTRAA